MKPEKLTRKTFAPYGTVLSEKKECCDAENEQFSFSADIALFEMAGEVTVGILEGKPREVILTCMERHIETPEILFQILQDAILFVGRSDYQEKGIKEIKAFLLKPGQTILMAPGTWHWVPYPVEGKSCVTQVIFKRGTSDTDCKIVQLPESICLEQ